MNYLRISFPVNSDIPERVKADTKAKVATEISGSEKMSEKTESSVLQLLLIKPDPTITDIADELKVTTHTVERDLSKLKKDREIVGEKKDAGTFLMRDEILTYLN